jgi:hypothetical protein
MSSFFRELRFFFYACLALGIFPIRRNNVGAAEWRPRSVAMLYFCLVNFLQFSPCLIFMANGIQVSLEKIISFQKAPQKFCND